MELLTAGSAGDDGCVRGSVSYGEVKVRLHPALVVCVVVAVSAAVVLGLAYHRSRRLSSVQGMAAFLPAEEGGVLGVDVAALRKTGLLDSLAGSGVAQEPEYVSFVRDTGFDYTSDLDYALVWFGRKSVYALLRGRFQWDQLRNYAARQGGACRNAFCRMEGSTPERRISFFPLTRTIMALAVSGDDWAATALANPKPSRAAMVIPDRPVWLLLPGSTLAGAESLPAGTRLFAKAVEGAERVMLTLGTSEAGIVVELDVTCKTAGDAATLEFQLRSITDLLKRLIAREQQTPNSSDLSGVLAAGVFNRVDRRVLGRWPVSRQVLEYILGGSK
jgi:hypothetical protein